MQGEEDARGEQDEAAELLPEGELQAAVLVPAPRDAGELEGEAARGDVLGGAIAKDVVPAVAPPARRMHEVSSEYYSLYYLRKRELGVLQFGMNTNVAHTEGSFLDTSTP